MLQLYSLTIFSILNNMAQNPHFSSGELIFEDNFESFDSEVWLREPSNQAHIKEFQLFTDSEENSYVENGILHIRPTFYNESEDTDNMVEYRAKNKFVGDNFHPIRSARLSTKESFSFKYGTLEIRAKIPSGDWLFPALWMMPKDSIYGSWPASGEIDLMESRGNKNLLSPSGSFKGAQTVGSTLHWGPNSSLDSWRLGHYLKEDEKCFSSDFHVYKLVWTPESIGFYVDEEPIGTVTPPDGDYWKLGNFPENAPNPWLGSKSAPFDQDFYIILNLAVGGTKFFSDSDTNEGGKPWKNTSPEAAVDFWNGREQWLPTWNLPSEDSHLLIDYVRVYAL